MSYTLDNYNLVINDHPSKDVQEVILLQDKGVHDFIGASYYFDEQTALHIQAISGKLVLNKFPTHLTELILKDLARFVILELNEKQLQKNLSGNVYFPRLIKKSSLHRNANLADI